MKRADQKAATRAHLIETAREVFEAEGYEAGTIRALAKAAKLSTGAVFAHWRDKSEIHVEVYGAVQSRALRLAELASAMEGKPWATLDGIDRDELSAATMGLIERAGRSFR